jgi:hypothetical protein
MSGLPQSRGLVPSPENDIIPITTTIAIYPTWQPGELLLVGVNIRVDRFHLPHLHRLKCRTHTLCIG